jgi:hypothetical protein
MSDSDERLRSLDPAAATPYRHPNLDELVTRITRAPLVPRRNVWRGFQLRMAGAIGASALVTAGAVALLGSVGPGLSVLAIQNVGHGNTPSAYSTFGAAATATSNIEIYEKFVFAAPAGLSATPPTSPSFQLQIPSDSAAETSRIAAIFNVDGSPVATGGADGQLVASDAAGDSLTYELGGVPQWSYSVSSSDEPTASAQLPSDAQLDHIAQTVVGQLGYNYTISSPSYSSVSNADSPAVTAQTVSYDVDVNGLTTDQSVNFEIDDRGNIIAASGPSFDVASSTNYPLEGLDAVVASLNAVQDARFPNATTTTSSEQGTTTATTSNGPPVVGVTLHSATLSLSTYQVDGGTVWLLPVYNCFGTTDNGSTSGPWSELALDSQYVKVTQGSSRTPRFVNF